MIPFHSQIDKLKMDVFETLLNDETGSLHVVFETTATNTGKTRTVSQFITLMHHFVICIHFDELHYKELYVRPQRIPGHAQIIFSLDIFNSISVCLFRRSCTYEKYGRKC